MNSEGRVTQSETAQPTRSAREGTVKLGMVAAPDIPEKIAHELAAELSELLARRADDHVSWDVPVVVDPLTGSERETPELLDACRQRRVEEDWDLAVCLTDLPVYRSGSIVVADVSVGRRVAGLSLPALGATRLRRRTRDLRYPVGVLDVYHPSEGSPSWRSRSVPLPLRPHRTNRTDAPDTRHSAPCVTRRSLARGW